MPAPTVVRIIDGDTIDVQTASDHLRIRLACIDAPELAQEPYGILARDRLQQLLPLGATVRLRTIAQDRYGRTVAEVFYQGQNLNVQLVREGYAAVYRQYLQGCDRNLYLPAELEARQKRLGFWQSSEPVMPWDFRHNRQSPFSDLSGDRLIPVDCYSNRTS